MGRRQARRMVFVKTNDLDAEKTRAKRVREVKMYQRNVQISDPSRMHSVSSMYGLPFRSEGGGGNPRNCANVADSPMKIEVNEKGGSFGDQFFATLQRSVQQKVRSPLSFALELVVPVLFVVGTIILWAAFGDETVAEASQLNYTTVSVLNYPNYYSNFICNNQSMGVIPDLTSCATVTYSVSCEGDESGLPVKGLCYDDSLTPSQIVGAFVNAMLGNAAVLPTVDTLILHQWMAQKAGTDSSTAAGLALSSSGLTSSTRLNAIASSGNVYFAPAANVPTDLVAYINNHSSYFRYVNGGTFDTVEEANEHVKSGTTANWCVIEIESLAADSFDVVLHMNGSALPPLRDTVDITYPGGFQFDRGEMYLASGFSSLQRVLYDYHLEKHLGYSNAPNLHIYFTSFGSGKYRRKVLLETAAQLVAFILVLSFLYPVSQLTKQIVLEKELRIREAMLIMGLSNSSLYLSWFVVYALQYLFECIVIVVLLKVTYMLSSDPFALFLYFYLFALSTIPLSGLIASFFSKARLASMLGPLVFFVLSVPIFAFTSASDKVVIGVSILSPTAFAASLTNIMTRETSDGFSSGDFHNASLSPESWILLVMLAIDFVLYYLLMVYFDAVLPKDWGTTKHPLFFIIDPFKACCGRRKAAMEGTNVDGRAENGVFEDVNDSEAAVRIVGLRKEYKRGGKRFLAVNNLYWSMCNDEISVLLGHNGAGKTTTMNMMMGMIEPDEGDCFINGYSVCEELGRVRQQIGFCPQHNILWPELSCREHLEYFGKIKGLVGAALEEAVCSMLHEVDLLEKIDYPSKDLSGGQKRKLSVAMAFVGRSALIFLDEPTAGMDVGARRYTWELLRRMSESHTIMLTTHYMDEADLLGHRIGIMSHGAMQCSGSSMFLKSRLGVGYNMNVSVDPEADAEDVDQLIVSLVPSAEAVSYNGVDIMYKLPMKDVETFPNLLAGLEQYGEATGVRGYSLNATTLEEVFLQIALEDQKKHKDTVVSAEEAARMEEENSLVWTCEMMTSSCSRIHSQFRSSMAKRLWNAMRDRRMQCFQIACPVVCILLAMLLTLVKFTESGGAIDLSASMFATEIEMEVSNCEALFGNTNNSVRQDGLLHHHHFYNALDLSLYTIDTVKNHEKPRYTSMQCMDVGMVAAIVGETAANVLFYNTSAYHASGLVLNQFYNFLAQHLTGNTTAVLKTSTSSMPESKSNTSMAGGVQTILIGAIVMIPFTFLPSNPVAWVVKERECKARHLQSVSGLSFYVYWLTNFLFDLTAFVVTLILVIVIFLSFNRKEYVSAQAIGPTIVMFLVYGLSSTMAGYAISFAFNEHSAAQTVVMAVSFVTGFLLVMMVFVLSLMESTTVASDRMRWGFRLVPSFCVGESIINLAMERQKGLVGEGTSPWAMDVTGWPMIYMAAEFPVFLFITLFIDHPRRRLCGQSGSYDRSGPAEIIDGEDSDVEDERKAVYEAEENNVNEDVVRVVDLRKVYDNGKIAVRNLSFSILPDEVFGFLGTNGAGKTTALSMLCQEFVPSSGCAYVCGYDVVDQSAEALQCIGYCPQFDATLDLLTVEEHLYLYAGIRGIEYAQRDGVVCGLMRLCDIVKYAKTTAGTLSGGNRRKLSVAMALMGSPQVVFLDEPSAGMDPVARRSMWTAIQKVSQNCSIVLTTHHLEEVEVLADTVAIMADGALRCIGDKIHLKNKYGSGFEMSIRVADQSMRQSVEAFVAETFPQATLNEFKGQRFVYALPQDTTLSVAFSALQWNKERLGITDYSISATSLEQVFLRVSEQQEQRAAYSDETTRFTKSHATLHHYRASKRKDSCPDSGEDDPPIRAAAARSVVTSAAIDAYQQRRTQSERGSAQSIHSTAKPAGQQQLEVVAPQDDVCTVAMNPGGNCEDYYSLAENASRLAVTDCQQPVQQQKEPEELGEQQLHVQHDKGNGRLSRQPSVHFVDNVSSWSPASGNQGNYDVYTSSNPCADSSTAGIDYSEITGSDRMLNPLGQSQMYITNADNSYNNYSQVGGYYHPLQQQQVTFIDTNSNNASNRGQGGEDYYNSQTRLSQYGARSGRGYF